MKFEEPKSRDQRVGIRVFGKGLRNVALCHTRHTADLNSDFHVVLSEYVPDNHTQNPFNEPTQLIPDPLVLEIDSILPKNCCRLSDLLESDSLISLKAML